ncbi:unnamed protein product [Ilex paraguariensis]|uniref:Uncharacterized protein n=1 Tax=Ilex paraguariensis TaxID=185542 RepID=A0ABC8QNA8_9AQUA
MDNNDDDDKEIILLYAQFVGVMAVMYGVYYLEQYDEKSQHNCYLTQRDEHCHNLLRMNVEAFQRFVYIIKGTGRLKDTDCSVEEQLTILNSFRDVAPPISKGMLSSNRFSLKSRISKAFNSPILDGIPPVSEFLDKFKNCKLLKSPTEDGISPDSALWDISKT